MALNPLFYANLRSTLEKVLLRHYQQGAVDNILGIIEGVLQDMVEVTPDDFIPEMVQRYWKSLKLPLNYVYTQSNKDEWLYWIQDFFSIILKYPWEILLNKAQEKGVKKDLAIMVMEDYDLFRRC
jgi:hypothetical protein